MSKFKSFFVAGSLSLATVLSSAGDVQAQDVRVGDDALPESIPDQTLSVLIHKGIVLGVSSRAVLTFDPASGSIDVQYRDGVRHSARIAPSPQPAAQSGLVWVDADTAPTGTWRAKELCGLQADTLRAAIQLVQAACAGGPSNTCAGAQESLGNAYADYQSCLRNALK